MKRSTTGKILKIGLLLSLISATVCTSLYACMSMSGYTSTVDLAKVNLIQLEEPKPEDPVAVIRTSLGDISVRLFPEEAPNAVNNFEELAKAGFYDDTYVFQLEPEIYFAAGSKTPEGELGDAYNEANESVEREISDNLWPFRGALCALTTKSDTGFWKMLTDRVKYYNGSRFILVDSIEFTDELVTEMYGNNPDNKVARAFEQLGGVPNYSQQMTIFGQTYAGFDVLDAITEAAVTGEENQKRPAEEIRILTVEITTYQDAPAPVTTEAKAPAETTSTTTTTE
ncbi:peptidylprolyl isomerase [Ruminococcus sp.]|uniref:peptidylprolyl isomerase n=1 Tax=Ruminococcus sp. TaxID=41978 RepID=UPI0026397008|nr:peptidylprolyl isomerase [Ruminococcus sp.]MDD7556882.1 peptidylprolyl isomerase [Ruminococcus sp.]MDY4963963.1 peptidylprolyl isomerase [Ruminococcus callidus]